jgi:NTP pyrophosphatase (non-canonical NTP hydrolase)
MSYPLDPEETIEMLSTRIGTWAERMGFLEDWELAGILEKLAEQSERYDFGHATYSTNPDVTYADILRKAAVSLRNNVVGTKLMLIVTEAAEAMESLRDVGVDAHFEGEGNIMEELADIEIRVKQLAHQLGGGLGKVEMEKIRANNDRPHKHGRKL